jgi:anti-anti-sigma regulatory factor
MTIKLEQANNEIRLAVISIQGPLNASNYKELINVATYAKKEGAQYLYIDMSEMTSLSSSGIFALYSVALLMNGKEPPNPEYGWSAYHALIRERGNGRQENVKLLKPPQALDRSLEITGMEDFFEILSNQDADYQITMPAERLLTDPVICC